MFEFNCKNFYSDLFGINKIFENNLSFLQLFNNQIDIAQNYWISFSRYLNDFMTPYTIALSYFNNVERDKILQSQPLDTLKDYIDLLDFNIDISNKGFISSLNAVNSYNHHEIQKAFIAFLNTLLCEEGEDVESFTAKQAELMKIVTYKYMQAILDIEPEYGFHFEKENTVKIAETDRFLLYQVLPSYKDVDVRENGKPIIIIPPYVLGPNILAFLPGEDRSYVHCFANKGIPTYIRIVKDIESNESVQLMTGEDDTLDTKFFCKTVKERHGQSVTLNGYCQGGFISVCNLLTGELDGLVDSLITCVSPMDGTKSRGLSQFLKNLPQRFNDLAYGTKLLPNGNQVADGDLMGWIYKVKSIENEAPLVAFYRDLMMFNSQLGSNKVKINKAAAAINYWLNYDRRDLPLSITRMSFESYNNPVTSDGTLPVKLFNKELNFKRIKEKSIKWLICYGENDDLVEKESALAPIDYIDAEITPFPKGHVAMVTSWSNPKSECALHTRFGPKNYRGPVRFHLDLDPNYIIKQKVEITASISLDHNKEEQETKNIQSDQKPDQVKVQAKTKEKAKTDSKNVKTAKEKIETESKKANGQTKKIVKVEGKASKRKTKKKL